MTHKLKAFPYYQVAKIVSPADESEQSRPYFLVETIYTSGYSDFSVETGIVYATLISYFGVERRHG